MIRQPIHPLGAARRLVAREKTLAALLFALLIVMVYPQVVFLGRSLIPSLYFPDQVTVQEDGATLPRRPAPLFDIDMSTPAHFEFPVNRLVGRAYLQGQFPLWNPYQAAGTPLAAQYNSRALFPYQVLEDVLPYWTWDAFILLRIWIAAFFMFLFLRALLLSPASAFVGGVFYALSGAMVWFVNLEQMANVAMTLPVLLFCVERLYSTRSARYVGFSGLTFGLLLLAGQPEVALYAIALAGGFFLFRVLSSSLRVNAHLGHSARMTMAFGLGLALASPLILLFLELASNSFHGHFASEGVGVANTSPASIGAYLLIPNFREFSGFGAEEPLPGTWDFLGSYTGILAVFFAYVGLLLRGPLAKYSVFFLAVALVVVLKNFGLPPFLWIGHLPLFDQAWSNRWAGPTWGFALAAAAAIGLETVRGYSVSSSGPGTTQRPAVVSFTTTRLVVTGGLLLGTAVLLISYSGLWPSALGSVSSERLIRVLALLGGVAFGVGATCLAVATVPARDRVSKTSATLGAGLTTVLVLLLGLRAVADPSLSFPGWSTASLLGAFAFLGAAMVLLLRISLLAERNALFALVALGALELWLYVPKGYDLSWHNQQFLAVAAGFGLVVALWRGSWRWTAASGVLFLGVYIAIDVASPHGLPARADPFKEPAYVTFLKEQEGYDRVMGEAGIATPNYASAVGMLDVRYVNSLTVDSYHHYTWSSLRERPVGFSFLDILWFTGQSVGGPPDGSSFLDQFEARRDAFSLLGVKYLVVSPDLQGAPYPVIYDDEVIIYENRQALPRAFVAHQVAYGRSAETAQAMALESDFDRRSRVVLEEPVDLGVGTGEDLWISAARISEYQPQRVVIHTATAAPGILVLTDVFYPGWSASVDGEPAPIYRVDGLFRGVRVPEGEHVVVMTYSPARFTGGLLAAGLAMLASLQLIVWPNWTRKLRLVYHLLRRWPSAKRSRPAKWFKSSIDVPPENRSSDT